MNIRRKAVKKSVRDSWGRRSQQPDHARGNSALSTRATGTSFRSPHDYVIEDADTPQS